MLDGQILTFDGYVNAYYQIKWIFSNIMDGLKKLISLRLSSQPKTEPDRRISFGQEIVTLDDLAAAVRAKINGEASEVVHISGDRDAAFGDVVAAKDRLVLGGVARVAVVNASNSRRPETKP